MGGYMQDDKRIRENKIKHISLSMMVGAVQTCVSSDNGRIKWIKTTTCWEKWDTSEIDVRMIVNGQYVLANRLLRLRGLTPVDIHIETGDEMRIEIIESKRRDTLNVTNEIGIDMFIEPNMW